MSKSNRIDEHGREILDSTPIAINVGRRKLNKFDDVRNFIRNELSNAARDSGAESWEEANDFDIPDDPLMASPWEYSADQEAEDLETIQRGAEALKRQRWARKHNQDKPQFDEGTSQSGTKPSPDPHPASQPGGPKPQ